MLLFLHCFKCALLVSTLIFFFFCFSMFPSLIYFHIILFNYLYLFVCWKEYSRPNVHHVPTSIAVSSWHNVLFNINPSICLYSFGNSIKHHVVQQWQHGKVQTYKRKKRKIKQNTMVYFWNDMIFFHSTSIRSFVYRRLMKTNCYPFHLLTIAFIKIYRKYLIVGTQIHHFAFSADVFGARANNLQILSTYCVCLAFGYVNLQTWSLTIIMCVCVWAMEIMK